MRIVHPLPESLRPEAAALYWTAFGTKLGRVLGPEARALDYFAAHLRPANALAAVDDDGRLLGLVAFRSSDGGFADIAFRDLVRSYGRAGAAWRSLAFRMISRPVSPGGSDSFEVEGFCVAPGARGRGVGRALLAAAAALARDRGFSRMRLEVTDTNLRARELYLRLGFAPQGTARVGALRHLFGFEAMTAMARGLDDWPEPHPSR